MGIVVEAAGVARTAGRKGNIVDDWSMPPFLANFLKAFVPIFFAVDAIGVLPIFMALTEGIEKAQRHAHHPAVARDGALVAVGFVVPRQGGLQPAAASAWPTSRWPAASSSS